ncbi:type VI secretion system baseplate subunit TssF [Siccibacter colletis]|uniref:Type VI secretion system baseplate subunit TssF n=1 Tax=Siccibacter colletis TaxID=1505757 RepID=A0ABY6JF57_9ENTR|nr:type VI secretion system baseplate subunit TssF [Siccibacter colletis]UYU31329.1 type VI secretion system baseplate subunit TssF [Siccibacter colletis]
MNQTFLDYYNKELTFMREMAGEFAEKHPKIAGRLGMHGIEVADPYVERLIEAFCFMSARTQLKLDAEFPHFTQRLLDVIYPGYNSPTPSIGVIKLHPDVKQGDLTQGYNVRKGSAFWSRISPGEATRCEFRTGQDVTLWPLEIIDARLTSSPPDIPAMEPWRIKQSTLKGALRIRLKVPGDLVFAQLADFDRLPVYIHGDERIVSHIFELIHAHTIAMIIRSGKEGSSQDVVINKTPLMFEGVDPSQSLLPVSWNIFHGHNLVHEYFACRQRFYFFTLTQLKKGLSKNNSNEAEVIILLDHLTPELVGHVDASRFSLFCTPAINLFPRRLDKIEINRALNEFHVVPDRSRPLDYEVYSIEKVRGQQAESSEEIVFNPLFQTRQEDNGNYGRYFSLTRKPRVKDKNQRKYQTRTPYTGTEVFISLVDQLEAPYSDHIRYLSVDAMVSNRDLPQLIAHSSGVDLTTSDAAPLSGATFICLPGAPRAPFAAGEAAWRLIRQLNFNYQPLSHIEHKPGGEALRSMLRLFVDTADQDSNRQISGLVGCKTAPVVRRLPGDGLLIYGRGIRCELTVDEECFSGISPYLFGLIMENYIARHASINVFTEMELRSMQRGIIGTWQARPGRRGAA